MAKLGKNLKGRWEKMHDDGRIKDEYALREDGVLLKKHTWFHPDGKVDFSDGWKIATRHPKPHVAELLWHRGYTEVPVGGTKP